VLYAVANRQRQRAIIIVGLREGCEEANRITKMIKHGMPQVGDLYAGARIGFRSRRGGAGRGRDLERLGNFLDVHVIGPPWDNRIAGGCNTDAVSPTNSTEQYGLAFWFSIPQME
jgi:hypothetical protein